MKRNSGGVNFPWLSSLTVGGILIFNANQVLAQVTPDNTLGDESSVVNPRDDNSDSIDGGALRGSNLFHSFQEFNVGENRGVYFSNPDAVNNIFSRVTGENVSNILGTLGVDGAANLYLINPNGIVFGENASLDVQGSFTATTADAIEFGEGGLFSAVEPGESLLTISVPLGLQFGSSPDSIINRSFVVDETGDFVGLQVPTGENLTLVGGEVRFEAGEATARGGNINIGGLSAAGTIGLNNDDGTLSFSQNVERADITFTNAADVDVRGTGSGNINLHARNLDLTAGIFGSSQIRAGILEDSTSPEAQAGNITINATDNLTIIDSTILNRVDFQAIGNAGNIKVNTGSLTLNNGGRISATTKGFGDAGRIEIAASDRIVVDGESDDLDECVFCNNSDGSNSGVFSLVDSDASGNAGGIVVSADSLAFTNGGRIDATTSGLGNAGKIDITATDSITIDGADIIGFSSGIFSQVNSTAVGNGEDIIISANVLDLSDRGQINSSTSGQGSSGKINIIAADAITINDKFSVVSSRVNSEGIGNAEGVTISTNSLTITNGGRIDASTLGEGNAGRIKITANDAVTFDGFSSDGFNSGVISAVDSEAIGNAGDIKISTSSLNLTNGGGISATTIGEGNAGKIEIVSTDTITFDGESSAGFPSGVISQVAPKAVGDAGGITISTDSLTLSNGGKVNASIFGTGNAGKIEITATDAIIFDGEDSKGDPSGAFSVVTSSEVVGNSGDVTVTAGSLTFTNGGRINANTFGQGNAGKINITATDAITFDGINSAGFSSGAFSTVASGASGNSGGINIATDSLALTNGGRINATTSSQGDAGVVEIIARDTIIIDGEDPASFGKISGVFSAVSSEAQGNSEGISISTNSLFLTNGGRIDANTLGQGNAGGIAITAAREITATGENSEGFSSGVNSQVATDAVGNSGGVTISTANLNLTNGGRVDASTFGQGNAGAIQIQAKFLSIENNAAIFAGSATKFDAADITLDIANSLKATDGIISTISSQSSGGNLNIFAGDIQLRGDSDIRTNINSGAGEGGNITIKADSIITFDDSDIFAFAADGRGGNIIFNTPAFFAENFTITSLTDSPDLLENNNRADVNATGAVSSGAVSIPDVSFIQNSLTELPDNSLNTDELVANSCVLPAGERNQGKFIITGGESLPLRPGSNLPSKYPTGKVRGASEDNSSWQPGDPIVEPQGVYRLANGKLVLSRECSQ